MQNNINVLPGELLQTYAVYRKTATKDEKGRVTYALAALPAFTVKGILSQTSQSEIELNKQIGHPVTHKLVCIGSVPVRAEDVLERDGVRYAVQNVHNPLFIGYVTTIYCERKAGT